MYLNRKLLFKIVIIFQMLLFLPNKCILDKHNIFILKTFFYKNIFKDL